MKKKLKSAIAFACAVVILAGVQTQALSSSISD